jgi:type I restriction enzyme M protein
MERSRYITYKDYLLGIVFYKYLSDSFLIKVNDLIYDEKPETLKIALKPLLMVV